MQAVNSKFEWARHHFHLYHVEMVKYMQVNPCKFVSKPNVSTDEDGRRWVMGTFECAIPIPETLSLIVGDCLGNLRSTLDYLIWELVRANGKKPGINNAFPIAHTTDAYAKEINNGRLRGVAPAAQAIIETLQPYHARTDAQSSLLSVLNKFVNINKHRRILLTCLKTVKPLPDTIIVDGQTFSTVNPPKFQGNAEFGPFEVIGDQVKVQAEVVAYIAFDEAPAQGFDVWSLIERMADYLNEGVFPQFDSFF
jgi:hypothetical protein